MSASFLIIGRPGRLRDSLCTILASFPRVDTIKTAEAFESGCQIAAQQQPSAVIIDGADYLKENCRILKKLVLRSGGCSCIIIVNTLQQASQARAFGADAVLLQGFSTDALQQTLISLDVLSHGSVGKKSKDAPLIKSKSDQRARRI